MEVEICGGVGSVDLCEPPLTQGEDVALPEVPTEPLPEVTETAEPGTVTRPLTHRLVEIPRKVGQQAQSRDRCDHRCAGIDIFGDRPADRVSCSVAGHI